MSVLMTRLRGSAKPAMVHLVISAGVALLALALIFLLWYPGVLAQAQGVSRLVIIMIVVDMVIGPMITLVVYAPGKRSLRFDLIVIAALQSSALMYGLNAIERGRPAYVVFNVDRFDLVPVGEVSCPSVARAEKAWQISFWGPKWVGAVMPSDPEKRSEIMMSAVSGGADLPQLPEYFVALEKVRVEMIKRLHPLDELRAFNEELASDEGWTDFLSSLDRADPLLMGYLPLKANDKDAVVILDKPSGEILGVRILTPSFNAPISNVPTAGLGLPKKSRIVERLKPHRSFLA